VTLRSNRRIEGFTNAVAEIGYQGVRQGDLVIHSMDGFAGAIGVSDSDGKASPVVHCYEPLDGIDARFYAYMLRHLAVSGYITSLAKGIRERSTAFDAETFGGLQLAVPSSVDQKVIADFLDTETVRMNSLIAKKRTMSALIEERRVAVTTSAVSGGEARARAASDSDWFPDLPSGWRMSSVGEVTRDILDGPHVSPEYVEPDAGGVPFISVRNISATRWDLSTAKYISAEDFALFCRRVKPERGDVLLTKGGSTGIARAVDLDFNFHVWVHVAILKTRRDLVVPEFLTAVLNSHPGYQQSQLGTRGATNQDLALGRISKIRIPLPPISEQERIAAEVAALTDRLVQVETALAEQVALLQEHRQALVAAATTGELEIRAVAA
jgi:type I restriction enzyme S subunit